MKTFKRLMVGLDISLLDSTLIQFTAFLSEQIKPEKIYFVHVHSELTLPDSLLKEIDGDTTPFDERIQKSLEDNLKKNFKNMDQFDVSVEVLEGSATKELLHRIEVKNVDLLIMGRKNQLPGLGVIPQQIARQSKCSVWFIPEKMDLQIKEILVPTDYSNYSKMALEKAIALANGNMDVTIICQNIYGMVSDFGRAMFYNEQKWQPLLQELALDAYNEFIDTVDTDEAHITPLLDYNYAYDHAKRCYETATKNKTDLIVVGSQGKTGLKRWLLGSFTEKLIQYNKDIPMLVVKNVFPETA